MSRVIEVPFSGDPAAVVAKAKGVAERHGAAFSGDHVTGTFAGNGISGSYHFTDKVVVVTIENKPDFAPWPMVEAAIRGFFESDPAPASDARADDTARANDATRASEAGSTPAVEPARRREQAESIIRKHVLWSSGAGLIPIPLADVAAVTGVQVSMLRDLTKLYGTELSQRTLENFVTALTGGMLARIGASAFKAIPGIGTLLGGASMSIMSGASTYAVGQVAKNQLEAGQNLAEVDLAKAKRDYDKAYESGKDVVENLKKDP